MSPEGKRALIAVARRVVFTGLILLGASLVLMVLRGVIPTDLIVLMAGLVVLLPRAVGMMREVYSSPPQGRGWLYNVLWSIPVMFILAIAGGILHTSSLRFLGFGVPPPTPELGGMVSGSRVRYMLQAPWMALWPGLVLALLSFVWVMAGDTLLERLDYRTKALWLKVVE